MKKLIKICEAVNKVLKAVWPYLVAIATGAVVSGCAIDKLMLELEGARTAGIEEAAAGDGGEAVLPAAVGAAAAVAK